MGSYVNNSPIMLRKGFIKLLKRYRDGSLPGPAKEAMDVWFQSIRKTPAEKNEREEIKERIWSGIREGKDEVKLNPEQNGGGGWFKRLGWQAAVVVVLAGTMYYFAGNKADNFLRADTEETVAAGWVEEFNTETVEKKVQLPDGSTVVLRPNARLRYAGSFEGDSRTVYLEGSGFFDVAKDPDRPFLVYAGAVVTRVVGTSFTITSIVETGGTEVAVMSGTVVVQKNQKGEQKRGVSESESRVVLTPNKKVTFFQDTDLYMTGLVINPVLLSNHEEYVKPGAFDFDETPLRSVIEKLEKAYGVEITPANELLLNCPITADLSSDSLYEKIEIVGAILNATVEITGSTILLSGGGCHPGR